MNHLATLSKTLELVKEWENELKKYEWEELSWKLEDGWTLGQVYQHLINATLNFHLKEIEICLKSKKNMAQSKNFKGFLAFRVLHAFPPVRIKVPASEAYTPRQPKSRLELENGLKAVKSALGSICSMLEQAEEQGKTPHPAFGWLNGDEWFLLIGMHFRHHLRQKARLDQLLKIQKAAA